MNAALEGFRFPEQTRRCCWTLIRLSLWVLLSSLTFTLSAVASQGLGVRMGPEGVMWGWVRTSLEWPNHPPIFMVRPRLERCMVGGLPGGPSWRGISWAWASDSVAVSDQTQTVWRGWWCLNMPGHKLRLQLFYFVLFICDIKEHHSLGVQCQECCGDGFLLMNNAAAHSCVKGLCLCIPYNSIQAKIETVIASWNGIVVPSKWKNWAEVLPYGV